ncbi:putative arabinase [Zopfochytrium polystomum]|nr:putative arabinase [Zopfochytrium polystomum]
MRLFSLGAILTAVVSTVLAGGGGGVAAQTYVGYAFFYFTGEGTATGEQVYAAISKQGSNSPLGWDLLNKGQPILTSTIGQKGVRDPFIVRSPDGSAYWLIATDMRAYSPTGFDWDNSQRHGSRNILVWQSRNLVNWTAPTLHEVMGPEAGNVWAPAAVYNSATGGYDVVFASAIYNQTTDANHTAPVILQQQVRVSTQDFTSFSSPETRYMYDPVTPFIDTTFLRAADGRLYRFTKNEGAVTTANPNGKMVFQQVSSNGNADGSFTTVAVRLGAPTIAAGEGPEAFQDNVDPNKYWLFIDEFTNRGYMPFVSTNVSAGTWSLAVANDATSIANAMPSNHARHGSILKLTQSEYDALRTLV